jgi:RNA polymerase sigma-70 factor (ECF subfamily)
MSELDTLLEQARAGNRIAWNTLLQQLRPFVRRLCRRKARDDVEASDLTQDVLARMDRGFEQFRGTAIAQLFAWTRQITARYLKDRSLGVRPPPQPLPPELADPCGRSPVRPLIDAEDMARLAAALEELPDNYRLVVEGRLFEGLSCVALARRTGHTDEWVRVTCKRAVERLHKKLKDKP